MLGGAGNFLKCFVPRLMEPESSQASEFLGRMAGAAVKIFIFLLFSLFAPKWPGPEVGVLCLQYRPEIVVFVFVMLC